MHVGFNVSSVNDLKYDFIVLLDKIIQNDLRNTMKRKKFRKLNL